MKQRPLAAKPQPEGQGGIKGVFSTQTSMLLDRDSHRRQVKQYVFVMAEEQPDGSILVQRLNRNFMPSGSKKSITRETLLRQYMPEPALYLNKVVPLMRRFDETLEKADGHLEKKEVFSAEFEYNNALELDESHVRATFGLGLTFLERGEKINADTVFKKLFRLNGAFEEKHKHLFNEFGIQMRKNKMYSQALKYYSRAYKLCKTDEHLLYNIARTLYEKGRAKSSLRIVRKAVALNPNFPEAARFLCGLENELEKTNNPSCSES